MIGALASVDARRRVQLCQSHCLAGAGRIDAVFGRQNGKRENDGRHGTWMMVPRNSWSLDARIASCMVGLDTLKLLLA